jgi:hypothetical protein
VSVGYRSNDVEAQVIVVRIWVLASAAAVGLRAATTSVVCGAGVGAARPVRR